MAIGATDNSQRISLGGQIAGVVTTSALTAVGALVIALIAGCRDRTRLVASMIICGTAAGISGAVGEMINRCDSLSRLTRIRLNAVMGAVNGVVQLVALRRFDVIGSTGTLICGGITAFGFLAFWGFAPRAAAAAEAAE